MGGADESEPVKAEKKSAEKGGQRPRYLLVAAAGNTSVPAGFLPGLGAEIGNPALPGECFQAAFLRAGAVLRHQRA